MHLRRVCQVAFTTGLLVVGSACGDVEVRASHSTSPRIVADNHPIRAPRATSTTAPPDVRSALTALAHARDRWIAAIPPPPAPEPVTVPHGVAPEPSAPVLSGRCGGDLPPCYVLQRESHGNPYAVEPGHQGAPYGDPGDPWHHASGLWQFIPSTWNGHAGYPYAAAAPVAVQNAKAREVWAGGAGCSHWSACG